MGATEETARLLTAAAERNVLADHHEREAVRFAAIGGAAATARAADHFIVAAGLRGRARFVQ